MTTHSQQRITDIVNGCPTQLSRTPPVPVDLMRQAFAAYLKARNSDSGLATTMQEETLVNSVTAAATSTVSTPATFANQMLFRRYSAYRPDCSWDQTAWECLLAWYAKPENEGYWLKAPGVYSSPSIPDTAYDVCMAPRTGSWGDIIAPDPSQGPVFTHVPGASDAPSEGAALQPSTPSGLKWVGIAAALGIAGVGIWYLTKQPSAAPAEKRRRK